MANFSLYISGQTELGDVAEFFQKRLLGEGETPVAFFDGVFYESHQERVGNIVYQDYLIYSDKALYLWARGASKDFLDRFTLGTVSVNSRNKDSAFATMNLKIRREAKEPVFVIFDMVEIHEADMIVKLQTVVEATIEDYLGVNYRQEIPHDTASRILQAARNICPPRMLSLPFDSPQIPVPDAGIGYGQDLLEQYKASSGYSGPQAPYPPGSPYAQRPQGAGMGAQSASRGGLESMLPTDPASLKRIADQIKNMVGDAPFKLRDQVMKDLQHVPGDLATVLTALNELLANIAGNPMAERFVMNAIRTAVANDGVIGSLGKIIKMTGFGSGGGKKSARQQAKEPQRDDRSAPRPRSSPFETEPDDDSSTIRRRKISIKDDEEHSATDLFSGSDEPITSRENRPPVSRTSVPEDHDFNPSGGGRRKKLSIRMEDDNEIARKMMSYDESERDQVLSAGTKSAPVTAPVSKPVAEESGIRKKKLSIKAEDGSGAEAEIARKLMNYDEVVRGSINSLASEAESEPEIEPERIVPIEPETPVRRKIQIVPEPVMEPVAEVAPEPEIEPERMVATEPQAPVRRKIQIVPEPVMEPVAEVAPEPEIEPERMVATEPQVPVRRKIQIVPEPVMEPVAEATPEMEIIPERLAAIEPEEPVRRKIQIVPEPFMEPVAEAAPEMEIKPERMVAIEPEEPVTRIVQIESEPVMELEAWVEPEPEIKPERMVAIEPEEPVRRAIRIVPEPVIEEEAAAEPEPEIESLSMVAMESSESPEAASEPESSVEVKIALEPELPVSESSPVEPVFEPEELVIPEHIVFAALGELEPPVSPRDKREYMTIESDDPAMPLIPLNKEEQQHRSTGKANRIKRRGRKN